MAATCNRLLVKDILDARERARKELTAELQYEYYEKEEIERERKRKEVEEKKEQERKAMDVDSITASGESAPQTEVSDKLDGDEGTTKTVAAVTTSSSNSSASKKRKKPEPTQSDDDEETEMIVLTKASDGQSWKRLTTNIYNSYTYEDHVKLRAANTSNVSERLRARIKAKQRVALKAHQDNKELSEEIETKKVCIPMKIRKPWRQYEREVFVQEINSL